MISGFCYNVRSTLFWDFKQQRMVVPYQHCSSTYLSHLQGSIMTLEDGMDRLSQSISNYHCMGIPDVHWWMFKCCCNATLCTKTWVFTWVWWWLLTKSWKV